jgi:hypothetical protein
MSVTVAVREAIESDSAGGSGEEGEERGRRQGRSTEGEGHIYRFPAGREKQHQSSISNKFIVPELRYVIDGRSEPDAANLPARRGRWSG